VRAPPSQLGVDRPGGSGAPGWAWAQPPGGAGDDTALGAHSVALMVANALRLEVLGLAWVNATLPILVHRAGVPMNVCLNQAYCTFWTSSAKCRPVQANPVDMQFHPTAMLCRMSGRAASKP